MIPYCRYVLRGVELDFENVLEEMRKEMIFVEKPVVLLMWIDLCVFYGRVYQVLVARHTTKG